MDIVVQSRLDDQQRQLNTLSSRVRGLEVAEPETGGFHHDLLSGTHDDTDPSTPPTRGSIIRAENDNLWHEYVIGANRTFLRSDGMDPSWSAIQAADLPNLGGVPALSYNVANAPGAAATYVRTDATIDIFDNNNPTTIVPDAAAAPGVIAHAARRDHTHAITCDTPVNIGNANAEGGSDYFSRSDHVHNHPAGLGADLHHTSFIGLEDTAANQVSPAADDYIQLRSTSGALTIAADIPNNRLNFTVNLTGLTHNILSATHSDTLAAGVSEGSLIYGNATPKWAELVHPGVGNAGYALVTTNASLQWDDTPSWSGMHTFENGLLISDDQFAYFGTDSDVTLYYDEIATNQMIVTGADWWMSIENLYIYGGDITSNRGAATSGLTRVLTIGGARNASGNDYASIDFQNYDSNNGAVDYIGARISSQNDVSADDGDLRFWTYDGSLTEQFRIKSDGTGYFVGDLGIGHDTPAEKVEIRDTSTQLRLAYDGTDYVNLTVTTSSLEISGPDINYVRLIDPVGVLAWDDIGGGSGTEGAMYDDSGSNLRYWLMFNSNTVILCNRAASGSVQFRANNAAGSGGESTIAEYFYNVTEFYVDVHLERSSGSPEIQFTDTSDSDYFELWHEQSNDRFRIASNSIDPIVTITKAGLVGIGVNALAPTAKLHVVQDVLSGPGPVALLLSQADVDQPFIEFTTGTMYTGKSTTNYYLKVKAPDGNEYYLRLFED